MGDHGQNIKKIQHQLENRKVLLWNIRQELKLFEPEKEVSAVISYTNEFIFFHIPKAGGTSVLGKLQQNYKQDPNSCPNAQNPNLEVFCREKGIVWPNHARAQDIQEFLGVEKFEKFFKFCFVRNPWDRMVSLYHYARETGIRRTKERGLKLNAFQQNVVENSFSDWILTGKLGPPQTSWFLSARGQLLVDFIGRLERIDEDLQKLSKILDIDFSTNLHKANTTKRESYQNYYNDTTRQIIAEKFAKEIELFGYEF